MPAQILAILHSEPAPKPRSAPRVSGPEQRAEKTTDFSAAVQQAGRKQSRDEVQPEHQSAEAPDNAGALETDVAEAETKPTVDVEAQVTDEVLAEIDDADAEETPKVLVAPDAEVAPVKLPTQSLSEAVVQIQAAQPTHQAAIEEAPISPAVLAAPTTEAPVLPAKEQLSAVTTSVQVTQPTAPVAQPVAVPQALGTVAKAVQSELQPEAKLGIVVETPVAATPQQSTPPQQPSPAFTFTRLEGDARPILQWPAAPEADGEKIKPIAAEQQTPTPQPVAATKTPMVNIAAAMMSQDLLSQRLQVSSRSDADPLISVIDGTETRLETARAVTNIASTLPTRADLPVNVARQIMDAIQKAPDKGIEIQLRPAELGRVRLALTPAELGMTISIIAERPETLDLMRRNIQSLEQAMGDLGYTDVSFSFGEGGESQSQGDAQGDDGGQQSPRMFLDSDPAAPEAEQMTLSPQPSHASDGLDLRL